MEKLLKIKLLLGIALNDITKDNLLTMLIDDAIEEVINYCNLKQYNTNLDSIVVKMVTQNYGKISNQGLSSQSYSDVSETYVDGYSADLVAQLNKNRRVKFL